MSRTRQAVEGTLAVILTVIAGGCDDGNVRPNDSGPDGEAGSTDGDLADVEVEPCPPEMILIDDDEGRPFCIDRFEHPGIEGQAPTISVPWFRAREHCADQGKELCLDDLWERACADTAADACSGNISTSGRRPECVNSLGVHDMPGNVAEWTASPGGSVTFWVRGGSGEGSMVGCEVREELDAEYRGVELGLRCCKRPR